MAQLDHVALAVADPLRSLEFYRDVAGFKGVVREEEYGFVITTPGGVTFTLAVGEPPPSVGGFHLGASLPDAESVRRRRAELRAQDVPELEWWDEPGYVSVKFADPDGYVVEISWEEVPAADPGS